MSTPAEPTAAGPAIDPAPRPLATNRRSRKKQLTRDRLMAAADELFATQGYEATTTNDVAEAADVAQRTLFRHFASKEALLYADMEDGRMQLRAALQRQPHDSSMLDVVAGALIELTHDVEYNRERRLLQARLAASIPAVSGHFRAVVQAGWEREIIAEVADRLPVDPLEDPRPEILAGAAMSAARAATRQWTAKGGQADYGRLLGEALHAIPEAATLR